MSEFDETQTVSDFLFGPCSMSLLSELSMNGEYWHKAWEFISDNEYTQIQDLSEKQKKWLFRIYSDLLDKAGV